MQGVSLRIHSLFILMCIRCTFSTARKNVILDSCTKGRSPLGCTVSCAIRRHLELYCKRRGQLVGSFVLHFSSLQSRPLPLRHKGPRSNFHGEGGYFGKKTLVKNPREIFKKGVDFNISTLAKMSMSVGGCHPYCHPWEADLDSLSPRVKIVQSDWRATVTLGWPRWGR
jgi:hypothetical protein